MLRTDESQVGKRVLKMALPEKRKRGRPKRKYQDLVKEDMAAAKVTEEDAMNRDRWRRMIRCVDS